LKKKEHDERLMSLPSTSISSLMIIDSEDEDHICLWSHSNLFCVLHDRVTYFPNFTNCSNE